MKSLDVDKPFKLTLGFWITYAVFAAPVVWISKSWLWDQPVISRVAGILLLPFLAAIVIFCSIQFATAVIFWGKTQRRKFLAFLATIALVGTFLAIEWARHGRKDVPFMDVVVAGVAGTLIYSFLMGQI